MSHKALRSTFDIVGSLGVSPSAKLVLIALSNRHNQETGRCDPSLERIASDVGINVATVRRALRELEKEGAIQTVHRVQRTGRGKRNMTNRYRICTPRKLRGRMGAICAPKQEYNTTAAFDDLAMIISADDFDGEGQS